MTTASTTQPQESTPATPPQGTHFFAITLELPGRSMRSMDGTYTPRPGETRRDVYLAIRKSIADQDVEMRHANLVCFSLEPNQL